MTVTPAQRVFWLFVLALYPLALGAGLYVLHISFFYYEQVALALAAVINVLILMQERRTFKGRAAAVAVVTAVTTFMAFCFAGVRLLID